MAAARRLRSDGGSRWLWVLAGGFAAEAAVSASHRFVMLALGRGWLEGGRLGEVFLVTTLAGLAAWTAIVAGLAGLLAELGKRSTATALEDPPRSP